jgi:two-component system phosphate regulon sensor histidine kinase PhoR
MLIPSLIAAIVLLALLCLYLFDLYRVQRSAITSILHLISGLVQRQYSRRVDPLLRGSAGELARATNKLAEELETRGARAQQDQDHLFSLLAMLDHTNEIALATDNMDTIRLANAAAARMLGRPVDQLLGKHIENIIHNPDLRALYRNAFSSTGPLSSMIAIQAPGRTLHCQATAATIYNGPHYRGTLLVLRDVTEIARALQMKTDFATNASHELRTPLASIRAAVETIKDSGLDDHETVRRCVEIINNHVLRLQLMVQDLLDLSRAEDSRALVRSDKIDLQLVCDALAATLSTQLAEKKLQLRIELDPDARTLRGDERLLMLVLKNLLDNAIKFTSQGSITIRSMVQSAEPALAAAGADGSAAILSSTSENGAHLADENRAAAGSPAPTGSSAAPADDMFVLEVQDTGIGIPDEDQERVFERFYTVNRSRGGVDRGTGLGLSIVKHAVTAMHGTVSLHSQLNHGTTVRCLFPIQAT